MKNNLLCFSEKTFRVLLQIILEGDYVPSLRLLEVKPFELLYIYTTVIHYYKSLVFIFFFCKDFFFFK